MSAPRDRLHALLVGIDAYLPNDLVDGSYPPLTGAVTDANLMYDCLVQVIGVPADKIRRLTASRSLGDAPAEAREDWPTYDRLVEALRSLGAEAQPGDQVLFYFAGHGGRVPAAIPELKSDGLDECLVPLDIGDPRARYLRDLELGYFVQAMAERGLQVTLILDCCHSGGATRDVSSQRGVGFIDRTARSTASAVASAEELQRAWKILAAGSYREVALGSGWFPEPRGFVLLAACRAPEAAFEHTFDGVRQGVFTHWLVDSLRRLGPAVTYGRLHDRVVAKVHSQFEVQTPVLEGDGARPIFGEGESTVQSGVRVLEVDAEGSRLLLAAGRVHGIGPGSLFAIFPAGSEELGRLTARATLAEVTDEIDGTICWAQIIEPLRPGTSVEEGALATLANPGEIRLRRDVRLLAGELDTALACELDRRLAATGFLEIQADGADFLIGSRQGDIEIRDPASYPLLRFAAATPAETIVDRLVHLAKFRNIQELDNTDPTSCVAGGIELTLGRLPAGWEEGRSRPVAAEEIVPLTMPEVPDGEWVCLQVWNRTRRRLYFAVLDLQPGWAIQQVAPPSRFADTLLLEAGTEMRLPLRARRGEPTGRDRDVLKVFASAETTDFRWLELPRLGEAPQPTKGFPRGPLEELFDQLAWSQPATRSLRPRPNLGWTFWGVAQVEFQVVTRDESEKGR